LNSLEILRTWHICTGSYPKSPNSHPRPTPTAVDIPQRYRFPCFWIHIDFIIPLFVQGGDDWDAVSEFYSNMYDCSSFDHSADQIVSACEGVREGNCAVIVGHNGPSGMGTEAEAICGADFIKKGGDWGDPDLAQALSRLSKSNRCDCFVKFMATRLIEMTSLKTHSRGVECFSKYMVA
jgi:hypothetical protein